MSVADQSFTATANASGVAVATITTGSRLRDWTVNQVSVEMAAAPIGSACYLRKNTFLITPLVPTGDAASGDPPVTLKGGVDQMTVTWTGVTPGMVGNVLVMYDDGN